jgi:hypothetical protein
MKKLFISMMIIGMLVIGCASGGTYYKRGGTEESFNKDSLECQMYANQVGYSAAAGYGGGIGAGIAQGMAARDSYQLCMKSKGWILEKK